MYQNITQILQNIKTILNMSAEITHLTKFKGNDKYRPLFLLFSKKMIATTTMINTRGPPTAPPTYTDVLFSSFASLLCFGVISEKNTVQYI